MVLDTKDNYLDGMREHFELDPIVTTQEVREAELSLNNHARAMVSMLNNGAANGQTRRCSRALVSNFLTIPVLQGLRKDHKPNRDGNPVLGPKLRPLCAANRAPNAAIGNLIARAAKAIGDSIAPKIGGEVVSTEDLKRKIEDLNKRTAMKQHRAEHVRANKEKPIQDKSDLTLFSMDVSALYPSITSEMAGKAIRDTVKLSKLE